MLAHASLGRLHGCLPTKMRSPGPDLLPGDPTLQTVIERDGLYAQDYAGAQARLTLLVQMGALTRSVEPDGAITYSKAPFPPPGDPRDWVDRANSELARLQAQERAILKNERAAREAATRALDAPIVEGNRRAMEALLQPMVSAWMDEHIGPAVDAAVERTLRASGLHKTDAASAATDAAGRSRTGINHE